MKLAIFQPRPDQWLASSVVLSVAVLMGCLFFAREPGEDLASSYVGCRLLASGQAAHLYSYDQESFSDVGDDAWQHVADATGYTGALHPYVQTPLWGYSLQPLCRRVNWTGFLRIFTFLSMLSFAGCLWLTAKYWSPSFFNPFALAIVIVVWAMSQPFQYAAFLMQTHVLLVFLTVAGLVLAERGRWISAGVLVAVAAAVKLTPVLLVLYWLLTRRWKAALATLAWSGLLWGITLAAVGHQLAAVYLTDLHRISQVLLVPMNNQSFAAWLMASHFSADEIYDSRILPLPDAVRLASTALMVLFTALGGWVDRKRALPGPQSAPLGAMIVMVAATVFAPIAWTHYSVLLVLPLMILIHQNREVHSKWLWLAVFFIMLLNFRPIATDINHFETGRFAIVRGQFYACVLTLGALGGLAYLTRDKFGARQLTS